MGLIMSGNSCVCIALKQAAFVQKDGDAAALPRCGGTVSGHRTLSWAVGSPPVQEQWPDSPCRALAEAGMDTAAGSHCPWLTSRRPSQRPQLNSDRRSSSQIGWAAGLEASSLWGVERGMLAIERTLEERCDSCTSPRPCGGSRRDSDLLPC